MHCVVLRYLDTSRPILTIKSQQYHHKAQLSLTEKYQLLIVMLAAIQSYRVTC